MPKYVRVRRSNGSTFTTTAANAKRHGMTVIDAPTHDRFGRVIPATPPTKKEAAAKKAAAPAPAATAGDKSKEAAK